MEFPGRVMGQVPREKNLDRSGQQTWRVDKCGISGEKEVLTKTILQFVSICTLMRNDDCFQRWGGTDIPL